MEKRCWRRAINATEPRYSRETDGWMDGWMDGEPFSVTLCTFLIIIPCFFDSPSGFSVLSILSFHHGTIERVILSCSEEEELSGEARRYSHEYIRVVRRNLE